MVAGRSTIERSRYRDSGKLGGLTTELSVEDVCGGGRYWVTRDRQAQRVREE